MVTHTKCFWVRYMCRTTFRFMFLRSMYVSNNYSFVCIHVWYMYQISILFCFLCYHLYLLSVCNFLILMGYDWGIASSIATALLPIRCKKPRFGTLHQNIVKLEFKYVAACNWIQGKGTWKFYLVAWLSNWHLACSVHVPNQSFFSSCLPTSLVCAWFLPCMFVLHACLVHEYLVYAFFVHKCLV